jgi:TctA family transporter
MRTSKHPERFGTGTPEGIIAPEASSISKEAGALIPTVALGVPNGPAMAVILAAFAILGLAPGPSMLTTHLSLVFWMVVVLAVSSLLASAVGLGLATPRAITRPRRISGLPTWAWRRSSWASSSSSAGSSPASGGSRWAAGMPWP